MTGLVIFGATGMLGQALMTEAHARGQKVTGVARRNSDHDLDLANLSALQDFLCQVKPEMMINSAAMISLVGCEEQPESAEAINANAVQVMADYSRLSGAQLVQISTDQYFRAEAPLTRHDETAEIHLVNVYARSKYAGEQFALTAPRSIVIRTNVTGCRHAMGRTFLEWAASTLISAEEIIGFTDYYTSTIDRGSLATALFDLIEKQPEPGVYNVASFQVCSKFAFLSALAKELEIPDRIIKTGALGSARPERCLTSGLDVSKAEAVLGYSLPGLEEVIRNLVIDYRRCWSGE
ncbi:MAG: SDR family oxidoreductase [Emcibacter sp.]|nr:SDR family oxidoreductase [Emcibacter sp.]